MELDNHHLRTIAHFDLDAFYVACERELNPSLLNQPVAVSQYNPFGNLHETQSSEIEKRLIVRPVPPNAATSNARVAHRGGDNNGSMIAVSYEARGEGIKRGDRGLDAVKKCPGLCIVQVPVKRGKADLTMYRNAGHRVMETLISSLLNELHNDDGVGVGVGDIKTADHRDRIGRHVLTKIKRADIKVEKASIDEIYIDLSIPVSKMTEMILSLQKIQELKQQQGCSNDIYTRMDKNVACGSEENQRNLEVWNDVLYHGQELGCTTIGGIETMSHVARAASELSKDEVRKGSQFQVQEQNLDSGSQNWWQRPLVQWEVVELRLACGSALAARARYVAQKKFEINGGKDTGKRTPIFTLSGGISSNKTLAKLASGLKKPNRQTMINPCDNGALTALFHPLKINRLRGLGGKFGESVMEMLTVSTVGDLAKVPLTVLKQKYPPAVDDERPIADFLWSISKGVCTEEVSDRTIEKSISSGKTFRGMLAISSTDDATVRKWISELVGGLLDRLNTDYDENMRLPSLLVLSIKNIGVRSHAISKSVRAPQNLSHEAYVAAAMRLCRQFPQERDGKVYGLTVTASNFNAVASGESSITGAFQRSAQMSSQQNNNSQTTSTCTLRSPKRLLARSHIRKKNPLLESWGKGCSDDKRRKILQTDVESEKTPTDCNNTTNLVGRVATTSDTVISSNGIDKSILSQLPASIQSEIRVASMSRIGGRSVPKRKTEKSSAGNMKNWLSHSTPNQGKVNRSSSPRRMQEKQGPHASRKERSMEHSYKHEADIDTEVLAELPFHIQALIRKEMRASKIRK